MPLDPRLRFDTLIVGAANRLAAAAARAVAESPGTVYNPLFVYGGPGLGKTHLLGAIAHDVRAHYPALTVSYMPLDDLVEEVHSAIAQNTTEQLRERLQRVQVLLLDDVQFLTGRREMQSEVLRLLNTLQAAGRQIVMASDRAPADIADVDERLISRLSGGLIVDLAAPDYETRVAIVRANCQQRKVELALLFKAYRDAGLLRPSAPNEQLFWTARRGGTVELTPRGQRTARFSRWFRAHWLPRQRLLMGEYTDDLTNPFRLEAGAVDYTCGAAALPSESSSSK